MSFIEGKDFSRRYRRDVDRNLRVYSDPPRVSGPLPNSGDASLVEALRDAIRGKSSGRGGDASALPGSSVLEEITDPSGAIHGKQQPKG